MLYKRKIPPTFSMVKEGSTTLFIKEGYKETILRIVSDNERNKSNVASFAQNRDSIGVKFGRGSYLSIPVASNGKERFVIRDYKHGGLLGKLFGGLFLNGNRPLNEIFINEIAFQRNVPTAEVIAVTKRKLWGLFYKASFISKEVTDAVDIIQFFQESSLEFIQKSKRFVISTLVKLIRNMHDAGIYHADLHLKNILLKENTKGEFNAYIIDLDKSVFLDKLTINQRIKNLLRLDRSVEKLRWFSYKPDTCQENTGCNKNHPFNITFTDMNNSMRHENAASIRQKIRAITRTDRVRFFKSYMLYNNTLDKNWRIYIRRYNSYHFMHKFWWCISDVFQNKSH